MALTSPILSDEPKAKRQKIGGHAGEHLHDDSWADSVDGISGDASKVHPEQNKGVESGCEDDSWADSSLHAQSAAATIVAQQLPGDAPTDCTGGSSQIESIVTSLEADKHPGKICISATPTNKLSLAYEARDKNRSNNLQLESKLESDTLTVYIGNISFRVEKDQLELDMSACGAVRSCVFLEDDYGRSKGVAFVTFVDKAGVEAALKMDGDEYWGRDLKVGLATASKGSGKCDDVNVNPLEVFVKGFPLTSSREFLRRNFAQCGEIEEIRLPTGGDGQLKGFGFLTFTTKAGVDAAILFDGKDVEGSTLAVNLPTQPRGKGADKAKSKGNGKSKNQKGGKGKGKGKGKRKAK